MFQDLRYGVRMLLNRPGFSAVVVLVLGLGIGATSAIFSVVNAVLLRPLPYREPDRLMMSPPRHRSRRRERKNLTVTAPGFLSGGAIRVTPASRSPHTPGAWPGNLAGGAEPERVRIARVTENLFDTLGVQPLLDGHSYRKRWDGPRLQMTMQLIGSSAVILSYGLWQRRFGADPNVIGGWSRSEGDTCSVIGVMSDEFKFPDDAEASAPVALSSKRNNAYLRVVARSQQDVVPGAGGG